MSEKTLYDPAVNVSSSNAKCIRGREREYNGIFKKGQEHLLDLSYMELEERNLEVKAERIKGATSGSLRERLLKYLNEENRIKAVTVCFTDLEGSFHALDYDKKHIIRSEENLTFDGSSINGFTAQSESDLRLKIDWTTFRWVPADLFGPGKVLVFANVCDKDSTLYVSDFRSSLYRLCERLKNERNVMVNIAPEIEGFIFKGFKAEQNYDEKVGFELATMSGYFNSLPQDTLRLFIDKFAEVQRALAFENEKDHPEVAPAQFELTFKYSTALDSADQIQLYKLLARQVARSMGLTASFLPKPIQGLNGSGMHTNISLTKNGKNIFYDGKDKDSISRKAYRFIIGILSHASELCLVMNSSVNAYRRLDPAFEAPNEIKFSAVDRGAMIRIPIGNEDSARVEVRTVAPDSNPYLYIFSLIKAGLVGIEASKEGFKRMEDSVSQDRLEKLPIDIYAALGSFVESEFMGEIMGKESHKKFADLKRTAADRCPRALGIKVKSGEVLYHHEITNQLLWKNF
ncbi:glutamine synthetase [Candidatus Peregrinibacteria bacterium]|nr:glutamine synthetase [Candidatus Peregrinibacteria bacterium]